jgi:outer membrane protein TolC
MELLEMELQLLEDRTTIQFRKNQTLPLVTLDYRYNINAFGGSRGDSYDMLYDSQYADHYFGLNARIPLGNQSAKSQLRQARLQRYQRIATRKNREALIKLEVLNAIDQLESNWQRIMATQQNVLLAGRLYEAEKRQFELGLRTSTDVLDTQASLANAQSAEIAALVEYQVAMVDLAYATGMLLGAANVDWEPIVPEMTSDS